MLLKMRSLTAGRTIAAGLRSSRPRFQSSQSEESEVVVV